MRFVNFWPRHYFPTSIAMTIVGLASFVFLQSSVINVTRTNRVQHENTIRHIRKRPNSLTQTSGFRNVDRARATRIRHVFEQFHFRHVHRWGDLLHALRLWGSNVSIADSSGKHVLLLSYVLDAQSAANRFGEPIQVPHRFGLVFRQQDVRLGLHGEPHPDATLMVLGQIGITSDQAISFGATRFTVSDVVRAAMANCTSDQEMAFTIVALGYYLPPETTSWENKHAQRVDFPQLCEELCREELGVGSCVGTHNLYAMAALLNLDDQHAILSPSARNNATLYLKRSAERLRYNQRPDGSWDANWSQIKQSNTSHTSQALRPPNGFATESQVIVTSHSLEWLAIVPDNINISIGTDNATKALDYLVQQVLTAPPARLQGYQTVFSHAGNALKLWYPTCWQSVSGNTSARGNAARSEHISPPICRE